MSFYRFAKMQGEESVTHLYLEGVIEAERPWWDEDGQVLCPESFRAGMEDALNDKMVVHVNSPGGDLSAGIAIFEMIRQRRAETRCEITYAASAATLIPCACRESYISPAGIVMMHNPQMAAIGDEVELSRVQAALKVYKKAAIGAYKERMKKSEEEISAMMNDETWLNAQAAVDLGLCDGILPGAESGKSFMYSRQAVMKAEQNSFQPKTVVKNAELEARKDALRAWAKS